MLTSQQIALYRSLDLDRRGRTITIETTEQQSIALYKGKVLKVCSGHPIHTLAAIHFWSLKNDFRFAKRSGYFGTKPKYEIEGYSDRNSYRIDAAAVQGVGSTA